MGLQDEGLPSTKSTVSSPCQASIDRRQTYAHSDRPTDKQTISYIQSRILSLPFCHAEVNNKNNGSIWYVCIGFEYYNILTLNVKGFMIDVP